LKLKTDILIIGGGISGLTLAIKLAELSKDQKILIITKETLLDCNTYNAQGGIACAWDKRDSVEKHIQDTLLAGDGLCDETVVREIIAQAPARINELIEMGVKFNRNENGDYDLGIEGGHSKRRVLHVNDLTGQAIQRALIENIKKLENVEVREYWCAVNLYVKNTKCYGAHVLEQETEEIHNISAKATILATGGAGKIYYKIVGLNNSLLYLIDNIV